MSGVYCMHMCVNFQKFLEIVSLADISVTLTSVRLPIFIVWKMNTRTTLYVNDEGAMEALSFSVARIIHAFVHSS